MIEQTILQGLSEFHDALSGRPTSGAHDLQQRIEALTRDERTELQQALGGAVAARPQEEEARPSINAALETMGRIEIARDWMRLYLEKHESSPAWAEAAGKRSATPAGHQKAPTSGGAASPVEYVCPRGDYRWQSSSATQSIPRCPIHSVALNPTS